MTRFVAFDFDGTLSDDEMVVLLGERAGCADEIASITERAMEGELKYAESLRRRVAQLEGLSEADVRAAYDGVRLREGTADLLRALDDAGVRTAIVTGGFEAGVERALDREDVTVDAVVANRLPTEAGALTGAVEGSLIEGTKDDALGRLADEFGAATSDAIAVGDGANDVPMLDAAGFAVGFRPKASVSDHCDVSVTSMAELSDLLSDRGVL